MDLFTEVYLSLINLLQTKSLESSWTSIEAELKALCQNEGPDNSKSNSLKKARDKIESAAGILDILSSKSLQLARKWSMDTVVKLGNTDAETLALIKRWFHSDADTEQQVKASIATLLNGFKKISNTCNFTSVIFSDRPHYRTSGAWDDAYASVNAGDTMPVIYLYQLFLDTGKRKWFGNIPKLWLCALTVVHELSHKMVRTEDISYDYQGLRPGGTISPADARKNADSWAYFCANIVGALSDATVKDVLR